MINVSFDLSEAQQERMITAAIRKGWLREEPGRTWTKAERRAAIVWLVYKLVEPVAGEKE